MNLKQLIESMNYGSGKITMMDVEKMVCDNPEQLKELDFETISILMTESLHWNLTHYYMDGILKFGIDAIDSLQLALLLGDIKSVEHLLSSGEKSPRGPGWYIESLAVCVFRRANIATRYRMLVLLLENGYDCKYENKYEQNILHVFIKHFVEAQDEDGVKIAEVLVNFGARFDKTDNQGWSPLLLSVGSCNIPLVTFFLEKMTDVNQITRAYNSWQAFPLLLATIKRDEDMINLLISYGAKINLKTSSNHTPLHEACNQSDYTIIELLIWRGADVNAANVNGQTPFSLLNKRMRGYLFSFFIIIKEISRLSYKDIPISEINLEIIRKSPQAREHFNECLAELDRMTSTLFYEHYSYYFVLEMTNRIKRLAKLTRNAEFVENFDVGGQKFVYYESNLRRIWNEAIRLRDRLATVTSRLDSVFHDFLPLVIIEKLSNYLYVEDLPLE